ncbi:hypothetical protein ABVK25_005989 [Lepraria finkii]|uniref:DUF7728 domain-containing protein n=1 Tax=Lepraria finkii TaxID=1340010 RepID=A0ABR4B7U6_9LECA
MLLPSLLSAGVFGAAAQAFLLPETVNLPPAHGSNDVLPTTIDQSTQVISLDCSTCPYALSSDRNGVHEWTANIASDLEIKVESDGKTLNFNGVPFYPISSPSLLPVLSVSQSKKDSEASTMEGYHGDLRLSYSMEYDEKKFEENSLVTVLITIMGLDGQMIKVDNIEIKAIKQADGTIQLHSVTIIPASASALDANCETILCRVFTKILTGMKKAKATAKSGAHKMKCFCVKCFHKVTGHKFHKGDKRPHPHHKGGEEHHGGMPHRLPDGTMELPSHIHFKPAGGHKYHHHHHQKGFFGRVARVLRTTVKIVFVPILIGVAFGMAASAVGMLAGQMVVYLWMKFRGTKRETAYERLDTDEKDAPPAYQDVQGVEVMTEKEVEAKA